MGGICDAIHSGIVNDLWRSEQNVRVVIYSEAVSTDHRTI